MLRERQLEVLEAVVGGAPGVALRGELDLAGAPELSERLELAILESQGAFVIDLCELEFLDSSGMQVLLRALGLLGREDRQLVLVCPPGPVRRALDVAGLRDVFLTYETRAAAARALVPAGG